MALPPALLQFAEQHGCFSGCYGSSSNLEVFTSSAQPPVPTVSVTCLDCLAHVGVLASLLPKGMYSHQVADQLAQHVRARRGYSLSTGGYHSKGPGFWFSAAYWTSCNVFLLDGERSRQLGTDLDLLMLAFQHGVLKPPIAGMLNPASFTVQALFHDGDRTLPNVSAKADLLTAPGISVQPVTGWRKLTMAEFVASLPQASPAASAAATVGQFCPKCGAEIRERSLLNQTFIGCMC
jgi:hypothetical protein